MMSSLWRTAGNSLEPKDLMNRVKLPEIISLKYLNKLIYDKQKQCPSNRVLNAQSDFHLSSIYV